MHWGYADTPGNGLTKSRLTLFDRSLLEDFFYYYMLLIIIILYLSAKWLRDAVLVAVDTEELAYLLLALLTGVPPLVGHRFRPPRGPRVFVSRWLVLFFLLRNGTGMLNRLRREELEHMFV